MPPQYDQLLVQTAHDGAFAPLTPSPIARAMLADEIMQAWYLERHDRIEAELFLEQARALLRSILAEGQITSTNERKVRRLLRAIRALSPRSE